MSTAYPNIFNPIQLGHLTLNNRILMGSMHTHLEETEGGWDRLKAYYVERVKGGVQLIITGGVGPNKSAPNVEGGTVLTNSKHVSLHQPLTEAVHEAGGYICLQILHTGRYAFGSHLVAPSAITAPINQFEPHELTSAEVKKQIIDFVRCANLAKEAGYDGVEIMGSEGYFLNQFISLTTNQRTDEWGGEYENRIKIITVVIKMIRKSVGPDFLIIYRLSLIDLIDKGSSIEEIIQLAKAVEKAGANVINTGIGWHESRIPTVASMVPRGAFAWVTAQFKEHINLPLVACNRINTPELAEDILAKGMADMVSIARPFLADPEFIIKAEQNRSEDINTCIGCNQACMDHVFNLSVVSCLVNPRACNEESLQYLPTTKPKRIAVVGAGPSGLTCATIAAKRGHKVTLYDASDRIGGQFNLAKKIPGKQEFNETLRYYQREIEHHGVELVLQQTVTPELLEAGQFDEVVVATGVTPNTPDIPGIDHPKVLSYIDVLNGKPVGNKVAIIGAGGIGFDVAEFITHHPDDHSDVDPDQFIKNWGIDKTLKVHGGLLHPPKLPHQDRQVTLLQRKKIKIGHSLGKTTRWIHLETLELRGVTMLKDVNYQRIDDAGLHVTINKLPRVFDVDTVIVCAGQNPNSSLAESLKEKGFTPHVIGGALLAKQLDAKRAIQEGALLAASI